MHTHTQLTFLYCCVAHRHSGHPQQQLAQCCVRVQSPIMPLFVWPPCPCVSVNLVDVYLPCGVTHRNTGDPQQQLAQLQLLHARAVANQQLRLRVNKARRQLMAEARLAAVLAGRSAGRSLWCWWEQLPNMLNIIY
jgi:hypothetical protein